MAIIRTFIGNVKGDKGDSAEIVYKHKVTLQKGVYNVEFTIYNTSSTAFTKDDIKTKLPYQINGLVWEDDEDSIYDVYACGVLNTSDDTGDGIWVIHVTYASKTFEIYPDTDSFTFTDKISKL